MSQFDYEKKLSRLMVPEVVSALGNVRERRGRQSLYAAVNLPRFRLHPYAATGAASSMCFASNSSGLRSPSAECIRVLL